MTRLLGTTMSYLEHESIYRGLASQFLQKAISADDFVTQYFARWKTDRDVQWNRLQAGQRVTPEELALSAILDPIFTACDAFESRPQTEFEIDEEQLTQEVRTHARRRWAL
ncbi:colicin immunity domain-containing protein [Peristeroidobacter agariperforans]|uniref:colicin immunity domain-containing protein n=1 Tax=Peristeroidobacter agariperforans TaxID=268404 RepID=UPI00101D2D28|nr:colicin immunity domain-containing protein [Peristeroidobacter agariperforans]